MPISPKPSPQQIRKLVLFWKETAEEDFKTAESLFQSRRYAPSLFFLHLAFEKLLKALLLQNTEIIPPLSHDLPRLAELAQIRLLQKDISLLRTMNQFNIRARYDDYKRSFYKRATREYTKGFLVKGKKLFKMLLEKTKQ